VVIQLEGQQDTGRMARSRCVGTDDDDRSCAYGEPRGWVGIARSTFCERLDQGGNEHRRQPCNNNHYSRLSASRHGTVPNARIVRSTFGCARPSPVTTCHPPFPIN